MSSKILSPFTNDFQKCALIFQETYFQLHLHKHISKKYCCLENVYFDFILLVFFLHSKEKITFAYVGLFIQCNVNMVLSPGLFEQLALFDKKIDFNKCKSCGYQSHFLQFLLVLW